MSFSISKFLGLADFAARDVETVEAARAQARAQRTIELAKVEDNNHRRQALLLVDDSDSEIAAIDADTARAHLVLERLDALEPALERELEALRDDARRAKAAELRARYFEAAAHAVSTQRAAIVAVQELVSIHDGARTEGFEAEMAGSMLPPPRMLSPELVDAFERDLERIKDSFRPAVFRPAQPTPPRRPVVDSRRLFADRGKLRTTDTASRSVSLNDAAPIVPRSPRPPAPAASPGGTRIQILKSGVEINGHSAVAGEELVLEPEAAMALLRAGAADIVAGGPHA